MTSQQESTRYLARAAGNYTPPGPAHDPWGPYIREAAAKYDVPERWVREVMRQESGGHLFGRGGDLITSGAGAMGLMQVMPATYDDLRSRYPELGDDPFDPHNNILAGTAYIREMYDIYGAPGFLAAYNAGPGRLDDYLTQNRTLPAETRRYVASIGPRIAGYEPRTPSPGAQYAMNAMPFEIPSGPRYQGGTAFAAAPSAPIVLNAPVQVAEAPPSSIKLNPPAPVQVAQAEPAPRYIHLNPPTPLPEPDAPPVQVADAEPSARPIHLNPPSPLPEPIMPYRLAEAEPRRLEPRPIAERIPERAPPAYARSHSLLASASRWGRPSHAREMAMPEPPRPAHETQFAQRHEGRPYFSPPSSRPIEVAEFPEPARSHHFGSQQQAAASELVPVSPQHHGFGLISQANAAPFHHASYGAAPSGGAWAVQVGAFSNQGIANAATEAARDQARDALGRSRPVVAGVHQQGGTLYRARLTGLSREAATHACERLGHSRTNCMVISPESQR